MGAFERVANGVDSVIGLFSPVRQLRRMSARELLKEQKKRFAAGDMDNGWSPAGGEKDINQLISQKQQRVSQRVKQLVRDFPFFARAVSVRQDLVVGTGIKLQSRVRRNSEPLRIINKENEDFFKQWEDIADSSGVHHFSELCRLAKKSEMEDGEYLFIKREIHNSKRIVPFSLQLIEPSRLSVIGARVKKGNIISQGIEFEPKTGQRVAYHIENEGYGKPVRIPAEYVIHGFKPIAPGQIRGISPLASGVVVADYLHDLIESTLDTTRKASKYLGFVTTPDISGFQKGKTTTRDGKKIENIESTILEYLNPGEKVEFADSNMPGTSHDSLILLILRMLSVSTETPFEMLTANYSGLSYSNHKGSRADMMRGIRSDQQRMIKNLHSPVYKEIIRWGVLTGKLKRPGFFETPEIWLDHAWIPPGLESTDNLRDSKGNSESVKNGLRSPQQIFKESGQDMEEVLDDLSEFYRLAEEKGVPIEIMKSSTSIQNNPAALGAGEERE
ncbi:MAG: phage portal protein [Desulfobacteraceae bacterium]